MKLSNRPFLRSVGMMIGAVIGVGVFGLPYAFAQSGFALGILELLVLGGILTILQLMLGEVTLQTDGRHRLVSYVGMYVGPLWKWVALVAVCLSVWGAMLAYMVVGGSFLSPLLSPWLGGTQAMYSYVIAGTASLLIYGGLRFAAKIEYIIVGALFFLFLSIMLACIPLINVQHDLAVNYSQALAPYGVILFALSGMGIVPELREVLGKKQERRLGSVIVTAMVIICSLYALFGFAVVGVTGLATTPTAFDGLVPYLGDTFQLVGTFLASLTILSIYMVLGIELLNTFKYDFRLHHQIAWVLVCVVPIVIFGLGMREFINIIGFVGSVFGGFLGILIALTYWMMRKNKVMEKHHCIRFPAFLTWIIILVFSAGMMIEIYSTLMG